jgi:hypothetical protein
MQLIRSTEGAMTTNGKMRFGVVSFKRLFAAVSLTVSAISVTACGGSPTAPASAASTYTVSGIVFERTADGTEPVQGIRVEDAASHRARTTDNNGFYSIQGLPAGVISLSASGSYYYVATVTLTISGDASKDIEIREAVGN